MYRKTPFSIHVPAHLYGRSRLCMHTTGPGTLGRSTYYINQALNAILTREEMVEGSQK